MVKVDFGKEPLEKVIEIITVSLVIEKYKCKFLGRREVESY